MHGTQLTALLCPNKQQKRHSRIWLQLPETFIHTPDSPHVAIGSPEKRGAHAPLQSPPTAVPLQIGSHVVSVIGGGKPVQTRVRLTLPAGSAGRVDCEAVQHRQASMG